jgi:hypothetical protein
MQPGLEPKVLFCPGWRGRMIRIIGWRVKPTRPPRRQIRLTMQELTIRRPDDWHLHLRDGAQLAAVLPFTAQRFARAVVMPNLDPPVTTAAAGMAERKIKMKRATALNGEGSINEYFSRMDIRFMVLFLICNKIITLGPCDAHSVNPETPCPGSNSSGPADRKVDPPVRYPVR